LTLRALPRLNATSDKLLHLDVLRFTAAAGIVFCHSFLLLVDPARRAAEEERTNGLVFFVDLFFVISGFVIAYVYSADIAGIAKFGRFMQRRVVRLVPLHWLTLVLSIPLDRLERNFGGTPEHMATLRSWSIAKTALLLHGILPLSGHEIFLNGQSWSISAEMAMYAAFPLFALMSRRWKPAPLIAGLLVFVAIGVYFSMQGTFLSYDIRFLPPVIRAMPSFLLGVILYQHRDLLRRLPAASWILAISLLGLIGSMLAGCPPVVILVLVYLTAAAAIASDMQENTGWLVRKAAPLGQLTYSIYMWHGMFIVVILNGIGIKLLRGNKITLLVLTFMCYGAILICSYFSYLFVETPARLAIDRLRIFVKGPRPTVTQ
jgi:peptidoglycan/LPS O-acetylase OafA/YrhL